MTPQTSWIQISFALVLCLAVLIVWALGVGAASIPAGDVVTALTDPNGSDRNSVIVWTVRMPRILTAILVGAALAVAGAVMQAVTGNPLADPGLLGVNAGAALAVVLVIVLLGQGTGRGMLVWAAFGGATLAAIAVYGLGAMGRSGPTPIKLVLAGVIIGTFLGGLTAAILIFDSQTLEAVRQWTAGSLRGRRMQDVLTVAPYVLAGLALAMALRDQFTALSLGSDVAQGLGQNPALWRSLSALVVVMLAGGAVSLAGPLGFVGLVVPHMVRLSVGADYRNILPLCVLGGALLTLLADTLPRALWANDIPAGVSLAVIGAPFFIWLARRQISPKREAM